MALLVSTEARRRFRAARLSVPDGKVSLDGFRAARQWASLLSPAGERGFGAGELNALSLIEEILAHALRSYTEWEYPELLSEALVEIEDAAGADVVERVLARFAQEFSLSGAATGGARTTRPVRLQELILFWLLRQNPAASHIVAVLQSSPLPEEAEYRRVAAALHHFLSGRPGMGAGGDSLLTFLTAPFRAARQSLGAQLRYMLTHWRPYLGEWRRALLSALDLLAEEETARFAPSSGAPSGRLYIGAESEGVRYSADRNWMTQLVLVAKNALVWLDQLSRQFGRSIERLDQIPEEALSELSRRGFNGLWLIGVWERSPSSARIKQLCGNPEAVASAYSLVAYRVADELGGDAALSALRERAWRHGIRLAADMVPNHTSIDSEWLLAHPEWFLSSEQCPFPSYTFDGPDLSPDPRIGIHLEDRYYDRSDAAVVFRRTDRYTGETRYVYHGNDGTSMPWNDTAQLDYLNAEARGAVIDTIVDVARRFPIIRFDAAMTLAKLHYARLWFPPPGGGGAIPSRAEYAMAGEKFDRLMPREFWREVVERIDAEAPGTLLLAEAFWLMEGYFVRTLGMHRVYNSAFMHMLRDQDNASYRTLLRETLDFDPQILKRYVNFMSNPDERTAIDQFGSSERYFGVCALMATLPGVPMFGHGQVEGFAEKYGMEYRRAYYDERPDPGLVARHEAEIAPLLRRREMFAEVDNFKLFDCVTTDGGVNEDVVAFSNGIDDERMLVVFNNRGAAAHGSLSSSDGDTAAALALSREGGTTFIRFRDRLRGLEYLRRYDRLGSAGLEVRLEPFEYRVFGDFEGVPEEQTARHEGVERALGLAGCDDLGHALLAVDLEPAAERLSILLSPRSVERFLRATATESERTAALEEVAGECDVLADELAAGAQYPIDATAFAETLKHRLGAMVDLPDLARSLGWPKTGRGVRAGARLRSRLAERSTAWGVLLAVAVVDALRMQWEALPELVRAAEHATSLLSELEPDGDVARRAVTTAGVAGRHRWLDPGSVPGKAEWAELVEDWLADSDARELLGVHRAQAGEWIWQEGFEELLVARFACAALAWLSDADAPPAEVSVAVHAWGESLTRLAELAARAEYRVDRLRELVR